ncbi:MAG: hypothetical protein R3B72_50660 [Polyangiaceae bacterium]
MRALAMMIPMLFALVACKGAALRAKAAGDFACSEDEIETEGIQPYVESASGCGHSSAYLHDGKSWKSPLERAAFDLSCPANELTTRHLGGGQVGVSGCGKKATYVVDLKPSYGGVVPAGWIMNTASTKDD